MEIPNVIFEVEDPDTGTIYEVEAPENTSPDDIRKRVHEHVRGEKPSTTGAPVSAPASTAPTTPRPQPRVAPKVDITQNIRQTDPSTRDATVFEKLGLESETEAIPGRKTNPIHLAIQKYGESLWRSGIKTPDELNKALSEKFGPGSYVTPKTVGLARQREYQLRKLGLYDKQAVWGVDSTDEQQHTPDAPETTLGAAGQAAVKSVYQMGNTYRGLAALAAEAVGAEDTADKLLTDYIDQNAAIEYNLPSAVKTAEDVTWDNATLYGAEIAGELLPQLASGLGGGLLGKKVAEKAVAKSVSDFVEDRVASGMAREAAETLARETIQKKAVNVGMAAGAAVPSWAQETGGTFGNTYAETGEKAVGPSLVAGTASAALDTVLPFTVLKKLNLSPQGTVGALRQSIVKEGVKGFATEGATEAAQEFITSLPKAVITGESPFTEEMFDQMKEAFIRGGLGGGAVRGATGYFANKGLPPEEGPPATISIPDSKRNTRKYKEQITQSIDEVVNVVNETTSTWTNVPNIVVEQNFNKVKGVDNNALGVYREDGTVLLNTETILRAAEAKGITPDEMVNSVVFHEALGHYGLEQKFTEELDTVLDTVYQRGTPEFKQKVDDWLTKNPEGYKDLDPDTRLIRATEEVLAGWSEQQGPMPRGVVDTVLDFIKNFARKIGIDLRYSSREVKGILSLGQQAALKGERVLVDKTNAGDKYSIPANDNKLRAPKTPEWGADDSAWGKYYKESEKYHLYKAVEAEEKGKSDRADSYRHRAALDNKMAKSRSPEIYGEATSQEDAKFYREQANYYDSLVKKRGQKGDLKGAERYRLFRDAARKKSNSYAERSLKEPPKNKYMRRTENPDTLTGEDLTEAENAYQILDRIAQNYTPQRLSFENIEQDALARGLAPSQVVRWVGKSPGELTKRMFMYDVAAEKLNKRLFDLSDKINRDGLNEQAQADYIKTLVTLDDLTAKIFQEQSELGRALGSLRKVNYTAKRVTTLRDALKEYNLEALADPETFYKLMADVQNSQVQGTKDIKGAKVLNVLNVPRAIMSSMDLSAPLRQGVVFVHRPEFWGSFFNMFKMIGPSGRANYDQVMREITDSPNYELMLQARLSFSDVDGKLSAREEDFQSDLAKELPVIGKGIKLSEQAYAGFLNKLRADVFNTYVEQFKKAGVALDQELLQGLGSFINSATGRAQLPGGLQSAAPQLNALFFSPRLIQSRLNMLNPYYYYKLPAPVAKEAMKSMLAFGTIASMTVGLIAAMFPDDVEVELDPRSSQWGKIKVDNTRFDIGGGFNQYVTFGAQTLAWLHGFVGEQSGMYEGAPEVKTSSGSYKKFSGEGAYDQSYGERFFQFFRSKLSPNAAFLTDMGIGEDYVGNKFELPEAIASNLTPMYIQGVQEAAKEYDPLTAIAVTAPGLFGVGVNTYVSKSEDPSQELEAPKSFEMKDIEDGENDQISASDGEITLKKEARERWRELLNYYYQEFVKEDMANSEVPWEDMTSEERKELIAQSKKDARKSAKADMMVELGLADEPEQDEE